MRKHFNLQLMNFIALLSVLMVISACKKGKELILSAPTVETKYAVNISPTWATLEGSINANNQSTIVTFEYDTTTSYKQSINATPDTINGNIFIDGSAYITGLKASTIYHFRVKAVNSSGTIYGRDTTFTTAGTGGSRIIFNPDLTYGSVTDNDGNTYKTIQIGTQTWMAENLKTTKYNDETAIPLVKDAVAWTELATPGYCWYTNDSVSYGALYNFYTINTGKLCPMGWHIPSETEWYTLINFLGGEYFAGGKMKETGTTHWMDPNTDATNSSGFSALPGGCREDDGEYNKIGYEADFWSITSGSYWQDMPGCYSLHWDGGLFFLGEEGLRHECFSVRCIKDE